MDHIIVVGDPGAGKSTTLNALCDTAPGTATLFRSGLSVLSGLTTALQTVTVDGVRYSDTPGLDDVAHKEQAAAAIADAVRLGGSVRLLFVVTMEAGRIRGTNLATIRIVLDALAEADIDIDGRYSVVLNKMSAGEMAAWGDPRTGAAVLRSQLARTAAVDQLVYVPRVDALVDAADAEFPETTRNHLVEAVDAMATMAVSEGTDIVVRVDEVTRLTAHYERELTEQRRRAREAEEEQREQVELQHAALDAARRRSEIEHATAAGMQRANAMQARDLEVARQWNTAMGAVVALATMFVFKVPFFP